MATIALRVPTVGPDGKQSLVGGHCYIIFTEPVITVRELITEKVRAELRKARAAGPAASSLLYLLPPISSVGHGPLDEQLAIKEAIANYVEERYQLWIEEERCTYGLDALIGLNRSTKLAFVITEPLPASAFNVPQHEREGWLDKAVTERKTTNNPDRRYRWSVAVSADRENYYVVSVDTEDWSVLVYCAVKYIADGYAYYQATADKEVTSWFGRKE